MAETAYEEARKCPKCGHPGNVRVKQDAPPAAHLERGTQIHQVFCENQICPWYNTPWLIQVNPDGTIPPPQNHTGADKVYVNFEGHDDLARRITEAIEHQIGVETKPGGEIRGR
jgi:hypothetical protein